MKKKRFFKYVHLATINILIGVKKLKYILQTLFCVIIKDVPENDVEAIQEEFVEKIEQIVESVSVLVYSVGDLPS